MWTFLWELVIEDLIMVTYLRARMKRIMKRMRKQEIWFNELCEMRPDFVEFLLDDELFSAPFKGSKYRKLISEDQKEREKFIQRMKSRMSKHPDKFRYKFLF
ncbi:hypothetical protein NQ117_02930 [Paenibacillus sp. SC116]|uniref:hypothetical protein n=1 Tax=Paenibacillus sp. SC116 TaxID=2968986 RepID=UPI00215A2B03|nr:hypothetical protein [Paenibacillus sp. SC116]MCR8842624.1 hypothetical protein [Paenibacillus sp. SC116]